MQPSSRTPRWPSLPILAAALLLPAGAGRAQVLHVETYRLDNGMTVILHEDHSLPVAVVDTWYGVGSKDESPGRSGFAHLFEHLMFMGTERVPGGQFDQLMESGGGSNNASTSEDRTNYYSSGPSSLLPTLLWLDADRLEDLGRTMTQEKLDKQREVVRNERRQSYENRPYGKADLLIDAEMFPEGHPYHHSVIGSHEDLEAATVPDVKAFFSAFYVPSNASLVVAGDFDPASVKPLIAQLFGTLPTRAVPEHAKLQPVRLDRVKRLTVSDDVQLARLTLVWHSPPLFAAGDADLDVVAGVLADGKSSRLYRRLVRDEPLCADITAYQGSRELGSLFQVEATCPPETDLDRVEAIIDDEVAELRRDGPTAAELSRVRNRIERAKIERLQGLVERADQLNQYQHERGHADSLQWDLARYAKVTPVSARSWAGKILVPDARLIERVLTKGPRDARPPDAAAGAFKFPRPETFTTAGGLKVHLWRKPELPLVGARLVLPRGATLDPSGRAGLSDLALDMLDEGTTRLSASAFAGALEQLGASMDVETKRESSSVSVRSLRRTFEPAFALFAEALTAPALDPKEWERVRTLHVQALQQRDDDPAQVAPVVANDVFFGKGHPFGAPIEGTVESSAAADVGAVREQVRRIVRPEGATLLVAGDISRADLERIADQGLGKWRGEGAAPEPPAVAPSASRPFEVVLVDHPGAVQTVVRFEWPAPSHADPDRDALDLLNTIFGGSFTSRLNQNLREAHGYTYGASSRFLLQPSSGYAVAGASVRADATGAALGEFLAEFGKLRESGVTAEEAAKAAATVRDRKIQATTGLDGILDQAQELVANGEAWDAYDTSLAALPGIDAKSLSALAVRRVVPRDGVLVLVGDKATVTAQMKGLDLPAPREVQGPGAKDAAASR